MEKRISGTEIYTGRAISVRVDEVMKPDGRMTTRDVVGHSDCVVVVPIDEDNNVLLVRQYRYPVGDFLLELPAGGIEPGEDPVDCVRRELQEEIGFMPGSMDALGGFYSIPGYGTEYLYAYVVHDLKPSRLVAEDTDEIEVIKTPMQNIPGLIESGKICDAKSIAALHIYMARQQKLPS